MKYKEKVICANSFSDKYQHQVCVQISSMKVSDIIKTNFFLSAM